MFIELQPLSVYVARIANIAKLNWYLFEDYPSEYVDLTFLENVIFLEKSLFAVSSVKIGTLRLFDRIGGWLLIDPYTTIQNSSQLTKEYCKTYIILRNSLRNYHGI